MCKERVTSNGKAFISISVADQRDAVRALKPGQSSRLSAIDADQRTGTTRRSTWRSTYTTQAADRPMALACKPTDSNRSASVCVPEAIQQQSVLLLAFPTSPEHIHNGSFCMLLALPEIGQIPRTLALHSTDHLFVLGQSSRKALHNVQQCLHLDTKLPSKSARSGC